LLYFLKGAAIMPRKSHLPNDSLIPLQSIPAGAYDFSARIHGLLDGQPKDEAAVAKACEGMDDTLGLIAAGLYSMASMLVGEGEQGVRLVETAVANAEVSACHDLQKARTNCRRALVAAALDLLAQRSPEALAAPLHLAPAPSCIEEDDLKAAGLAQEELDRMIAGPDRDRVRGWLAGLPVLLRTVFVVRAVAGFTAADTAVLLQSHGGPRAAAWTPEAVRAVFRQGLCSLASQLLQSSATR
jgi:hypothetical protein